MRHWPGDAGRPGLALHCMMGSGAGWGPVAAGLGGRLDLRGFDMPGHGRSAPWHPAPGIGYHTHVTRLAAGMIDRPLDLIGHSFGATVALRIAVGAPEAVRSLTLIEPVLFAAAGEGGDPEGEALNAVLAGALAAGRDHDAARAFLTVWGAQDFDSLPAPAQDQLARQVRIVADTHPALAEDAHNILRPGGLEGLDAPVMLVAGADSPPVIARIIDNLAARLPDVGRATVPEAAHMLPLTHPQVTAELIAMNIDRA